MSDARQRIDNVVRAASVVGYDPSITNAIISIFREAMLSEKAMMAARDIEMDMEGAWGFCLETTPAMLDAVGLVVKND